MTWRRYKYSIGRNTGCHQVNSFLNGFCIVYIFYITSQTVKLTPITVNGHDRCNTVADILLQSRNENSMCLRPVIGISRSGGYLHGSGILLITLFKPTLHLLHRIDILSEVIENLIRNIFLTTVLDIHRVANVLPEILNSLGNILIDIAPA